MSKKPTYEELEKRIEELENCKGMMEDMLEHARLGIYVFKQDDPHNETSLRLIFSNPASEKITGLVNEHILGKTIDESFPQWQQKGITSIFSDVIKTKEGVEIEDIYYKNEDIVTGGFLIKAYPVQKESVCVTVENISRRIVEKCKLEHNSHLLELAMQVGNLAWWELDIKTGQMKGNKCIAELLGFAPGEGGTTFDWWKKRIHPDDLSKAEGLIRDHLDRKCDRYEIEYRIKVKDGSYHWFNDTGRAVKYSDDGTPLSLLGFSRDITEKTKQEERLKNSLNEKEVLLREIHHRVKNNLQIIVSLIKLQTAYNKEPGIKVHLREISNRIKSMGIIHEKLYQTKDLSRIDFADYIRTLSNSLIQNFKIDKDKIDIIYDLEKICLPIDTAIPCGLIINEIISNSLKHAFPQDKAGKITIHLSETDENEEYCLIIGDNGIGLPENVDFTACHKLGLELIKGLTLQLKGTVEIERSKGTCYTIQFKNVYKKKYKQASQPGK